MRLRHIMTPPDFRYLEVLPLFPTESAFDDSRFKWILSLLAIEYSITLAFVRNEVS